MKKLVTLTTAVLAFGVMPLAVQASPKSDLKAFQAYYKKRFPKVEFADFSNGVYAIDAPSRDQWEEMEQFPPYELNIDKGEKLFNTPFKNGKTYASCFKNGGKGIKQNYPYYDKASKQVITLELAINQCRKKNGEKALKYKGGALADISAYMAYTSRGKTINIKVDASDPGALEWYNKGKQFFYAKRGQLNMACADCHIGNAGNRIRSEILGPGLGQPTHWPAYRLKWGALGTIHRRYTGCNKQVRSKPFKAQSEEYRALEYFHTYMSNGLPANGPGVRK